MASTRLVDGHLAIDLIAWKDHHPADRVADAIKRFGLHFRELTDDVRQPQLPREGRPTVDVGAASSTLRRTPPGLLAWVPTGRFGRTAAFRPRQERAPIRRRRLLRT
jgi:hypothetical protein